MATHSSILACEIPWDRGDWQVSVQGSQDLNTTLQLKHHHQHAFINKLYFSLQHLTSFSCGSHSETVMSSSAKAKSDPQSSLPRYVILHHFFFKKHY